MKFSITVILVLVLIVCSEHFSLSVVKFNACDVKDVNFQGCWLNSIQAFVRTFGQPLPLVGNVWAGIFEPLRVNQVTIGPGRDRLFNVQLVIRNVETYGWHKTDIEQATLELTGPSHYANFKGHIPLLKLKGQYEADGKILGKTFKGQGDCTIDFENVTVYMEFRMEPQKKFTFDFWRIVNSGMTIDPARVRFVFENQPQELIDEINEKWRDVFDDAKADFGSAAFAPFNRMAHTMVQIAPIRIFVLNYEQPLKPLDSLLEPASNVLRLDR